MPELTKSPESDAIKSASAGARRCRRVIAHLQYEFVCDSADAARSSAASIGRASQTKQRAAQKDADSLQASCDSVNHVQYKIRHDACREAACVRGYRFCKDSSCSQPRANNDVSTAAIERAPRRQRHQIGITSSITNVANMVDAHFGSFGMRILEKQVTPGFKRRR